MRLSLVCYQQIVNGRRRWIEYTPHYKLDQVAGWIEIRIRLERLPEYSHRNLGILCVPLVALSNTLVRLYALFLAQIERVFLYPHDDISFALTIGWTLWSMRNALEFTESR